MQRVEPGRHPRAERGRTSSRRGAVPAGIAAHVRVRYPVPMLTLLPVLVVALSLLAGLAASRSESQPDRVRRVLPAAFALSVLLRLLLEGLRLWGQGPLGGAIAALATAAGLGLFVVITQLATPGPYKRGARTVRFVFAALATIAMSSAETIPPVFLFWVALTRHPWLSVLTTAERFRTAVLAIVAALVLWLGLPPLGALADSTHQPLQAVRVLQTFALVYAIFTAMRAFGAFSRDPTLGIRRVSLRLVLSHVLVVMVPLLIVVALWVSSTYLGVNADRALLAGRLVQREAASLESELVAALAASPDPVSAARAVRDARGSRWTGLRAYATRGDSLERVAGEAIEDDRLLSGWYARSDSLPHSGVVEWSRRRWLGALAHSGGKGVLVLAPIRVVLDSTVAPLLGSPVTMPEPRPIQGSIDSLDQVIQAWESSARRSGGGPAVGDSARVRRARELARVIGVPDSAVRIERRGRGPRISTSSALDTLDADQDNLGLTGQVSVPGVHERKGRWRRTSFTLTVHASVMSTLSGLFQKVRENPYQGVSIAALVGLGLLLLPLFGTNLRMVRGMGGSITQAIRALRDGARSFGEGQLAHRIPIEGDDDLWDTARQFNQMAGGLERARELEKERDRIENELDVARGIQARLLPAGAPAVSGYDIAGRSESAREVGGDYYDHLDLGGGRWLFVIADVSGKGVPAALLMSGFRASLMSQAGAVSEPERIASRINEFLHRSVEPGRFVTAFFGFLETATGRFVYVNAGHNPPALRRADGRTEWLSEGGLILGILSGSVFASGSTTLEPGDLVTLYTDGVTEGADATGEQWGETRLVAELDAVHARPAQEIAAGLVTAVRTFEGASGPADDLTVLVIKRDPAA